MAVFRLLVAMAFLVLLPSLQAAAAGVPPITVAFDHLSTGFELDGVHRDLPCEQCHLNAVFKGTPRNCGICHITGSVYNATPKTQTHVQSSNNCEACHNGTSATGKNKGHLITSLECGDCHLTTTWLGAAFDHTGIKTGCFSCHNGVKAVCKQGNHMPTSNVCETCHTTGIGTAAPNWVPSLFVHTQMSVQTCATCHSGTVKISTGF